MDFFGVGPLEILLIVIIALLVMGPKQLPQMAFKLGTMLTQARRSIAEARDGMLRDMDDEGLRQQLSDSTDEEEPQSMDRRQLS